MRWSCLRTVHVVARTIAIGVASVARSPTITWVTKAHTSWYLWLLLWLLWLLLLRLWSLLLRLWILVLEPIGLLLLLRLLRLLLVLRIALGVTLVIALGLS